MRKRDLSFGLYLVVEEVSPNSHAWDTAHSSKEAAIEAASKKPKAFVIYVNAQEIGRYEPMKVRES